MSRKILVLMGWLSLALCFAGGSTARAMIPKAPEGALCLNCHVSETPTPGDPANWALLFEYQGETGCIACHSHATSSTTYVINPGGSPEITVPVTVYTGAEEPTEFLASGNFWWVKKAAHGTPGDPMTDWTGGGNDAGGHNIFPGETDERYIDPVSGLSTAPGHSSGCLSPDSCHSNLNTENTMYGTRQSCLKCHMMVTGLDYTGFHHADDRAIVVGLQKGLPGTPGFDGFYRFLTGHMSGQGHGVAGIEDDDWEATVSYIDHNEYLGFQSALNTPGGFSSEGHTSTGYCSGCHGNFHVASRYADGKVDCPPDSEETLCFEWRGHPVGMVLPSDGDLDFYRYTTYNPNVPLGRPDLSTFSGPSPEVRPGVDAINCLSCHRSHGTPGGSHLRWDPTDWDGCAQCHKTKKKWSQDYYLCDEIDDCNDCHTSHGKSLRFRDDEFGPTENDMLIWMRVEVKFSPVAITVPANTYDTYVQVAQGDIDVFEVGALIEIRDATNSQQLTITSVDAVAYQYHFEGDPLQNSYAAGSNLYHVELRNCTFPIPGDSPYVRADSPPGAEYDGICEVCHTETAYWKNDGTGAPHYGGPGAGEQCLDCHEHTSEFLGEMPEDVAHNVHTQGLPRGPDPMQCEECHEYGETVAEMADAEACDSCHSRGGAFEGVDDPVVGVKFNWPNVQPDVPASLDSLIYEADGTALKSGKKDWCAGCHDDGSAVVKGVAAPNVMGNSLTYGFNVSGHGRNPVVRVLCQDCHKLTRPHIDGKARTYETWQNNYKRAYRLNEGLVVPRLADSGGQFDLCIRCHKDGGVARDPFDTTSNFRSFKVYDLYLHNEHISYQGSVMTWDSDVRGVADSAMSCPTCHNAHGSPMDVGGTLEPNPVMIRHGELTGTQPGFNFHWYTQENGMGGGGDHTSNRDASRSGELNTVAPFCSNQFCHVTLPYYNREPLGFEAPVITKIGNRKCYPGEKIKIRGVGFGDVQGDSVVHIGPMTLDSTSPRIKVWTDTLVKVKIPFNKKDCSWFKDGDGEYRKRKVWVTVDGADSNKKNIRVLKPDTCP